MTEAARQATRVQAQAKAEAAKEQPIEKALAGPAWNPRVSIPRRQRPWLIAAWPIGPMAGLPRRPCGTTTARACGDSDHDSHIPASQATKSDGARGVSGASTLARMNAITLIER